MMTRYIFIFSFFHRAVICALGLNSARTQQIRRGIQSRESLHDDKVRFFLFPVDSAQTLQIRRGI